MIFPGYFLRRFAISRHSGRYLLGQLVLEALGEPLTFANQLTDASSNRERKLKTTTAFIASAFMMIILSYGRSNATTSDTWSDWLGLSLALVGSALGSGVVFFVIARFSSIKSGSTHKHEYLVSLLFTCANGIYFATSSYIVFLINQDETWRWNGIFAILAILSALMLVVAAFIVGFRSIDRRNRKTPHTFEESRLE